VVAATEPKEEVAREQGAPAGWQACPPRQHRRRGGQTPPPRWPALCVACRPVRKDCWALRGGQGGRCAANPWGGGLLCLSLLPRWRRKRVSEGEVPQRLLDGGERLLDLGERLGVLGPRSRARTSTRETTAPGRTCPSSSRHDRLPQLRFRAPRSRAAKNATSTADATFCTPHHQNHHHRREPPSFSDPPSP